MENENPATEFAKAMMFAYGALVNRLCETEGFNRNLLSENLREIAAITRAERGSENVAKYLDAFHAAIGADPFSLRPISEEKH
jgi:hypothetical protein